MLHCIALIVGSPQLQVGMNHITDEAQADEAVVHVEAQVEVPSETTTPACKPTDEASDQPEKTHTTTSSEVHEMQDIRVEVKL